MRQLESTHRKTQTPIVAKQISENFEDASHAQNNPRNLRFYQILMVIVCIEKGYNTPLAKYPEIFTYEICLAVLF